MELRNCRRCGKLFAFAREPICPDCQAEDERALALIKDYLASHPQATTVEVSEQTGVPLDRVLSFLRAGRLEMRQQASPGGTPALTCRSCGKPIDSGRFCRDCAEALAKKLDRAAGNPCVAQRPEMHTWKRDPDRWRGTGR